MLQVRYTKDDSLEMGVDEAGRGCLWGSLFAGAVIWPPEEEWLDEHREISPLIKDSKTVSKKKREILADAIESLAISSGVGQVSSEEIDRLGMTAANRLAFVRAIEANSVVPERLLIDGTLNLTDEQQKGFDVEESVTVVDGDALYLPIAAASILAKVSRDRWVAELVAQEPDLESKYSILSSKGYGTAKHRTGIQTHGVHREHRRLFLRKILGTSCLIEDEDALQESE
jgi:ribonuclease HII